MALHPDFSAFIDELDSKKVKYLIVGAYALAAYGYVRNTGDIDVWIERSPDNAQKVVEALDAFGFSSLGLVRDDFLEPRMTFQLGYAPVRIDILTDISGVVFNQAYERRQYKPFGGRMLPCISLDDLIVNKRASARPKDRLDLIELLGEDAQ